MGKLNLGDRQKGAKKEKQLVVNRVIWIEKLKQEVTQSQVFCPFFVCLFVFVILVVCLCFIIIFVPPRCDIFFPLDVKLFILPPSYRYM